MAKPAKGKARAKTVTNPKTGRKRTVSYGQAGKAKDGGSRVLGTAKGDAYCARSLAQMKKHKKAAKTLTALYVCLERDGNVREQSHQSRREAWQNVPAYMPTFTLNVAELKLEAEKKDEEAEAKAHLLQKTFDKQPRQQGKNDIKREITKT